jgi:hypothetical protein
MRYRCFLERFDLGSHFLTSDAGDFGFKDRGDVWHGGILPSLAVLSAARISLGFFIRQSQSRDPHLKQIREDSACRPNSPRFRVKDREKE